MPYDEPEVKELKSQALTDEKLDVIEVLDRKALFSNGRLLPEEIPEGLYAYDLRHSDDGDRFCSIEPKVAVNHGGTVLLKEVLDFGEQGYISLTAAICQQRSFRAMFVGFFAYFPEQFQMKLTQMQSDTEF